MLSPARVPASNRQRNPRRSGPLPPTPGLRLPKETHTDERVEARPRKALKRTVLRKESHKSERGKRQAGLFTAQLRNGNDVAFLAFASVPAAPSISTRGNIQRPKRDEGLGPHQPQRKDSSADATRLAELL
ncbi:hypothetical protein TGRH88_070910 [Toxoplasma gondii]|uniref:Uncharacterized protein n=1 Tax=Toxoplasma gondii TaxID=5811 RepID=A0A7J6K4C0_TOXGO|nr:hypothetical protein TGRH88_070910 [Toxoplasma gondii]